VLNSGAQHTSNSRLQYQLSGFGDTGGSRSTLSLHWTRFTSGIRQGLTDPFGAGSGAVNRASAVLSGGSGSDGPEKNTEIDLSNTILALGLIGGLVYLGLMFVAFREALRNFQASRDAVSLALLGVMISALGGWMSGGHYSTAPFVWLTLGVVAASSATRGEEAGGSLTYWGKGF